MANQLQQQIITTAKDSLLTLAKEKLGDSDLWREIADVNGLDIFEPLLSGRSIQIPSREQLETLAKDRLQQEAGRLLGDLEQQLDLSSLKQSNPFGSQAWQLIEWIL